MKAVTAAGVWFGVLVSAFALAGRLAAVGALLVTLSLAYTGLWALFRERPKTPDLVGPSGSRLRKLASVLTVGKLAVAVIAFLVGTTILGFSLRSPEKNSLIGVAQTVQERLGTPGARRSFGNGYQIMRDFDGDGSFDWSSLTNCGLGKISWRGYCWQLSEDIFAAIRFDTETRSDIPEDARRRLVSLIDRVRDSWRAGDSSGIEGLAWALNPAPRERPVGP